MAGFWFTARATASALCASAGQRKNTCCATSIAGDQPRSGARDQFFLTEEGTDLSANAVHCLFARIRIRTGIPISAHRLRHTGATAGARQKMPLDEIRKKLGHTTTKATVGYIHLAEQLPSADDQPSGLDYLNITLPKAKRRVAANRLDETVKL